MKGDFSRVRFVPFDNFNGILPQQGKVLLDSDGIAQTLIENDWHETAARDVMGETAAVPAAAAGSFQVSAATLSGGTVELTIGTGHLWADGLLVRLDGATGNTVTRTATWLEPPLVATKGSASDVAAGVQDAVILEVWQHAVNGYQMPEALIEPALGGPDTAERLQTSFAFRLARLAAGQTCADLKFDESGRGALTVSLVPPIVITGDCPVDALGGYSGFEHQLYRIEIADINGGAAQFKWSRTNGGLVGRGTFDPATQAISITANLPAITSANQTSFYLEIESYDAALGFSRVVAGAAATLVSGSLQCAATPNFGSYPATSDNVFFRLWDGISPVSSFPISGSPAQLENGILLQFDADGVGKYLPGDYWMFPVRAQGIANPQVLIDAEKPRGIVYHRVPLAEITWASSGADFIGTIEDCRTIVPPLSRNKCCCTYTVGDGIHSFGDFTSIQAAVDSLPAEGGEVCVLPGRYFQHVRIVNRRDIAIHGCGWQTRIASPSLAPVQIEAQPPAPSGSAINPVNAVITIFGSQHVALHSFAVEAADDEAGILLDGIGTASISNEPGVTTNAAIIVPRGVIDVDLRNLVMTAAKLPAILAWAVEALHVACNRVLMKNVRSLWPAIYASGREIRIERNVVGILTVVTAREWLPITVVGDLSSTSLSSAPSGASVGLGTDVSPPPECPPETREFIDASGLNHISITVASHPGGIQIGGPSADVYVLDNEIEGGSRNGITLGSFQIVDANGNDTGQWTGVLVAGEQDDCCGGTIEPPTTPPDGGGTVVSGGILRNIHIHRNRIRDMGLCGIGPVGFFNLLETLEVISIFGLNISHNGISRTLLRDLVVVDQSKTSLFGYGAICVPDVQDLIVCDNTITDFGAQPGLAGCGIFVLHGETLVISRNRIRETRDWAKIVSTDQSPTALHGGIVILLATPPAFNQPLDSTQWTLSGETSAAAVGSSLLAPVYEPGLPAARVEHNVVRVALGCALEIVGLGPFTIANNHFASGGLVRAPTGARPLAETVLIGNLGTAIDGVSGFALPGKTLSGAGAFSGLASSRREIAACGTVLFTGNHCQLETIVSRQSAISSVTIITADHLIFSNNHSWVDASQRAAMTLDALLGAFSLNVVGNRFQEAPNSVVLSGLTVGRINVTAENISTYCLIALGAMLSNNNNLALVSAVNRDVCASINKELEGLFG